MPNAPAIDFASMAHRPISCGILKKTVMTV